MLFLVRHAHAVPVEEDPDRPLSLQGVTECSQLIRFFRANGALPGLQFWHSPLARSRQTADRLADALAPDAVRLETPGLLPEDDPEPMARRLDTLGTEAAIVIVGHEPHLAHLATLLLTDRAKPAVIDLPKGGVLALRRKKLPHRKSAHPRWQLCWMVAPSLLADAPPTEV
jgi:phosphohistidine phosphatase